MDKLKILIADDESIIRMDLKEMLEDAGHIIVAEASDGAQAVELSKKLHPDLVIMDIKMPILDGIAASKVLTTEKIAPVLLLTAYSQKEIVESAKNSGVLAYLVKPLKEEQLFPAIEIAISRFREIKNLEDEIDKLKDTIEVRKIVEKAKGILMQVHNLTEDVAYKKLQQYCMVKRKTLKEVSLAIIKSFENQKKNT